MAVSGCPVRSLVSSPRRPMQMRSPPWPLRGPRGGGRDGVHRSDVAQYHVPM